MEWNRNYFKYIIRVINIYVVSNNSLLIFKNNQNAELKLNRIHIFFFLIELFKFSLIIIVIVIYLLLIFNYFKNNKI